MKVINKVMMTVAIAFCCVQLASAYVNNSANTNTDSVPPGNGNSIPNSNSPVPDSSNPTAPTNSGRVGVQPDSSVNPGLKPGSSDNVGLQPEGDK